MSPPSPGFRPDLRRDGTWRCPTVYLSYESNFRPLESVECQWSLSSLSLSLRLHHGMACVSDLELEQSWT